MLKKEDIDHLATLARITVSSEEKEDFVRELDAILAYVSELGGVVTKEDVAPKVGILRNALRADENPYAGGEFTEAILANAPHVEDGYVKVGQIM
jgi:aspartyl-tRNA(Asn)/glutamyl-tRNA(Gln) amidotransferase subunit C